MAFPDSPLSTPQFVTGYISAAMMETIVTASLNALAARVADIGWQNSGVVAAASGSGVTITSQSGRIIGPIAEIMVSYTIGGAVTVPTNGDITNQHVLDLQGSFIPSGTPSIAHGLASGPNGRLSAHSLSVGSPGQILLTAVGGSTNIASGDAFSFGGVYFLG